MKHAIISLLLGCYRWSLRLYPAAFRAEFGDEMEAVFATAVRDAAEEGPGTIAVMLLKETADFPANLADAYRQAALYPGVMVMKREASWNVLPLWVVLNLLALPLAVLAVMTVVVIIERVAGPLLFLNGRATTADLQPVILIAMVFLVMSVLQWLLLRRYLPYAGVWIPLTILGWLCGTLLFYLTWLLGFRAPVEWNATIALPVFGALAGGFQWLYLRRVIDHAGYWVLASTVGYGVIGFVSLGLFSSMLGFLFFLLAPFVITGLALFLLLRLNSQTGEDDRTIPTTDSLTGERQSIWPRRLAMALLAGLLLVLLSFAGSWVFATGQLTLAKAEGIYTTPEEGMEQRLLRGLGDTPVKRVDIRVYDGRLPHVWYVIGSVWADNQEDSKSTTKLRGDASYFLRVEDGWVHMPEGVFPEFVGWMMELYGLEGA